MARLTGSAATPLVVDTLAAGLAVPWDLAFLPDGRVLVTERAGRIRVIERDSLRTEPWAALPVYSDAPRLLPETGLMGIAVSPDYATTRHVYVAATVRPPTADTGRGLGARLKRSALDLMGVRSLSARTGLVNHVYRLTDDGVRGTQPTVWWGHGGTNFYHAGGALALGPDSLLYVSYGDAMHPELAGDLATGLASVRRIRPGTALRVSEPVAHGLRNVQGLDWHPRTQELFAVDHGPSGMAHEQGRRGVDELNLLRQGGWYGWGGRPDAPADSARPRPIAPLATWAEAIAPAGLAFAPPSWGGDVLLVTGLRSGALHRVQLRRDAAGGWQVAGEERLLEGHGRLRALAVGADGAVYVGTSNRDGRGTARRGDDMILRLRTRSRR